MDTQISSMSADKKRKCESLPIAELNKMFKKMKFKTSNSSITNMKDARCCCSLKNINEDVITTCPLTKSSSLPDMQTSSSIDLGTRSPPQKQRRVGVSERCSWDRVVFKVALENHVRGTNMKEHML